MPMEIRPETELDRAAIWNLNHLAFESDTEANLVDELRDGGFARLSLVADEGGAVVGHILLSVLLIKTEKEPVEALGLGPMAVLPSHQRHGIGSALVGAALELCRDQGHTIILVLGHPDYYPRFGFSAALAEPLESPFGGGDAWMALELVPGSLDDVDGLVQYPPPFQALAEGPGQNDDRPMTGAREVIPKLWIGNAAAARDLSAILEAGVEAVVDLAIEEPPFAGTRQLVCCRVPILDGQGNSLSRLRLAVETVGQLVGSGVPTLVTCSAGMSRSPAIVAAALSRLNRIPLAAALRQVTASGPSDVSPALLTDILSAMKMR